MTEHILNKDYDFATYIVEFKCLHTKKDLAIDKLLHYFKHIPRLSDSFLYIFSCKEKGNLFACFESIDGVNDYRQFEKMIINVLNSKVRLQVSDYELTVSDPYIFDDFHQWLYHCIHNNDNGYFTPYVDRFQEEDEMNIQEIIYNMGYIEKFEYSDRYFDIQDMFVEKYRLLDLEKKTKEHKIQICKEMFLWKINKQFRFTNDSDYLSKKVVCDMLDLDYKSKKDIRDLNNILTDYGVSYDKLKMLKGERGVFLCISLK